MVKGIKATSAVKTTSLEKIPKKIKKSKKTERAHNNTNKLDSIPLQKDEQPNLVTNAENTKENSDQNEDTLFWEYLEGSIWITFPAFCQIFLTLAYELGETTVTIDEIQGEYNFTEMYRKLSNTGITQRIRCRKIFDLNKSDNPEIFWQWLADNSNGQEKWEFYTKEVSNSMEQAFRKNKCVILTFDPVKKPRSYFVDLNLFTQTNLSTGTRRRIRRIECENQLIPIFDYWKNTNSMEIEENEQVCSLETLNPNSLEFQQVASKLLFSEFIEEPHSIICIQRVQNKTLYEIFQLQKKLMENRSSTTVLEKQLFHGTSSENVEKIIKCGFDVRYNKRSLFGKGNYFSATSKLAHNYATKNDKKEYRVKIFNVTFILLILNF